MKSPCAHAIFGLMTTLELETNEADRLAHELSRLTGESVTAVVIKALAAQLARERAARDRTAHDADTDYRARIKAHAARLRQSYDLSRPVTKAEWDEALGDIG